MAWPEAVPTGVAKDDFNDARDTFDVEHDLTSGAHIAGFKLPNWTTATRPGSPSIGMIGINTDHSRPEYYDGSTWQIM